MLFVLLMGCAKIPNYLLDPMTYPHEQCPLEEHLMAVAYDSESPNGAKENARRRVTEQIDSSISTTQMAMDTIHKTNETEQAESYFSQESVVQVDFDHYHLIKDISDSHRSRDGYRSLACLSLIDLEKTILINQEPLIANISNLFIEQTNEDSIYAFSTRRVQIYNALKPLTSDLVLLRRLLERPSQVEMDLQRKINVMEKQAQQFRESFPIYVNATNNSQIESQVAQLLTREGLNVQQGTCNVANDSSSHQGLFLDINTRLTSTQGPMGGEIVNAVAKITLGKCSGSSTRDIVLGKVQGYHSVDTNLAEKDALQKIVPTKLPGHLLEILPTQSILK